MTAADTAALIAEARSFLWRHPTGAFPRPDAAIVIRDLADALEQAESEIRADQMRRNADLLDEMAESISSGPAEPDPADEIAKVVVLRAAADRLRAQGGGQ